MQLFTIGTVKLNADGSSVLDSTGSPVPTYDAFRAWLVVGGWGGMRRLGGVGGVGGGVVVASPKEVKSYRGNHKGTHGS